MSRSSGRATGSSHVRWREKTRAMKLPSGGVTRNTASRKKRICSHPLRVMSELLRLQHRQHQVREQREADQQSDRVVEAHGHPSLHQPIAHGDVAEGDGKKDEREENENNVEHGPLLLESLSRRG